MIWAVAARYPFSEAEIWSMPMSRLWFWYRGHEWMHEEEKKISDSLCGSK